MKKFLISVALLLSTVTLLRKHPVMNSQPLYPTKQLPSKIRVLPELAGVLPPPLSWSPNYYVWEKENMISRKCISSVRST